MTPDSAQQIRHTKAPIIQKSPVYIAEMTCILTYQIKYYIEAPG